MIDRLWAGWRVTAMEVDRSALANGDSEAAGTAGIELENDQTLFEAILASDMPADQTHIIHRGENCFVVLNRYPYSTGHLLVAPNRPVGELEDLTPAERAELWDLVHRSVVAVKAAFSPDGVNIGANIGSGAGPSVPDHLHVHVVPRWCADTNFMTTVSDVRVLPLSLQDCWERIVAAWSKI